MANIGSRLNKTINCRSRLIYYMTLWSFNMDYVTISVLLAVGVRESSTVNNVFSLLNLAIIVFVIILGGFKGKKKTSVLSISQNFFVYSSCLFLFLLCVQSFFILSNEVDCWLIYNDNNRSWLALFTEGTRSFSYWYTYFTTTFICC